MSVRQKAVVVLLQPTAGGRGPEAGTCGGFEAI